MNKKDLTSRCTGIYFGEGPRWKENKLWFSDMQGDKVYTLDEDNPKYIEEVPEELEALNKIVPMIKDKTLSLREGAVWLEYQTGRKVSHMGLKKIAARHE